MEDAAMQQFIQMATSTLGTTEQAARTITAGLLDMIARNAPQPEASALLGRLPGAKELLDAFRAAPPAPPPPAPGVLGSLSQAASAALTAGSTTLSAGATVLGTGAAGLSGLATLFTQTGLDIAKVPQLIALFAQWASQQAGRDLVQRSLGSIPGASTVLATLETFGGVPGRR
jgi:hypothetical protein